jgi:hypothetical protein
MDTIDIFDIGSLYDGSGNGTWYKQKATGLVPEARMDFCLVSVSAADNSSYQIYLYGGRNNTGFFDDIYVLSLPSFTWIRIFTGSSPRAFHTCHLVGSNQIITIGGTNDTDFLRGCDWESMGVAIYNLNSGVWGSVYNASAGPYEIVEDISTIIGGGYVTCTQTLNVGPPTDLMQSITQTSRQCNNERTSARIRRSPTCKGL